MRHPREWFATEPDIDEDTPRPTRWWNWSREWNGAPGYGPEWRWRVIVGDVSKDMEHDTGEAAGAAFTLDVRLWENTGQFDYDNQDRYHDHSASLVVWRWGFYVAWRGGRK
ncbi:hypothetical protein AVT46_gp38 [Mycobacterium phage MOOREtheMARYer]|uniref:Uncharacterized protein n=1 Tax=Mycobacterium phage MOOREtheMARYer TaxID=1647309 RepID=A0A0F6YQI5_9CAUD|nr:hypothetical protein AVT46_gp38 [Mycobacterium phage MOOREtheMARYer]AKF14899.1 hypothetical protein SEA_MOORETHEMARYER_38 [Mycobacterium phage MOOREtheMARYer]